ncbi:MAG: helix-turn-helix domain-containing protein [Rhizobiales bacterium]|nr:helix-turn-helix domain-containing protein [Hyphomicrobiales bacterium]
MAQRLYPLGRWRMRIAKELGIGRSTLYRYLARRKDCVRGLDDELRTLMARERIASQSRARKIAKAEKDFDAHLARSANDGVAK